MVPCSRSAKPLVQAMAGLGPRARDAVCPTGLIEGAAVPVALIGQEALYRPAGRAITFIPAAEGCWDTPLGTSRPTTSGGLTKAWDENRSRVKPGEGLRISPDVVAF